MVSLIAIAFPETLAQQQPVHAVPKAASYRLSFAHCNYWEHPAYTVLEQYYQTRDIFLYLGEVKTDIDLSIKLTCEDAHIYWAYQLKGKQELAIQLKRRTIRLKTKAEHYRAVYLPGGTHTAYFKKGVHYLIFYFVVKKSLLLRFRDTSLHFLNKLLENLAQQQATFTCTLPMPLASKITIYLHRLFNLGRQDELGMEEHIPPLILRLVALARQAHYQEQVSEDKTIILLEQLRQQVLENIRESIAFTIKELAEDFRLNAHYLNQLHKRHYHESTQRFITRSKLEEGYRQIAEEGRHPTEVAFSLLFYDGSAFTKAFKKEFGITPNSLYQKCRKKLR